MFYVAIIIYSILLISNVFPIVGTGAADVTPLNIIEHFSLLFSLDPIRVNTLVPGGWSIATELLFYLTIPVIFTYVKSTTRICALLLGAIIANMAIAVLLKDSYLVTQTQFTYFWLPNQFPVFCLGVLLFLIFKDTMLEKGYIYNLPVIKKQVIAAICLLTSVGIAYLTLYVYAHQLMSMLTLYPIAFALGLFALSLAIYPFKMLVNGYMIYLGKVSYSCYLIHFIVVSVIAMFIKQLVPEITMIEVILTFAIALNVTRLIAHFTYIYIEEPGISIGKNLIKHLRRI